MTNYSLLAMAVGSGDLDTIAEAMIEVNRKICVGVCPLQSGEWKCTKCAKRWLEQEAIETIERDTKNLVWKLSIKFSDIDTDAEEESEEQNEKEHQEPKRKEYVLLKDVVSLLNEWQADGTIVPFLCIERNLRENLKVREIVE